MIKLTKTALYRIKEMRKHNDQEGYYFKFSVVGGGCSGLSYQMALVEKIEKEEQLKIEDEIILYNKEDEPIIKGAEIDFKENLMGGGFVINNPNAIVSCGCGTSFKALGRESKEGKCD